jgi:hypothetical protein
VGASSSSSGIAAVVTSTTCSSSNILLFFCIIPDRVRLYSSLDLDGTNDMKRLHRRSTVVSGNVLMMLRAVL